MINTRNYCVVYSLFSFLPPIQLITYRAAYTPQMLIFVFSIILLSLLLTPLPGPKHLLIEGEIAARAINIDVLLLLPAFAAAVPTFAAAVPTFAAAVAAFAAAVPAFAAAVLCVCYG